MIKIVITFILVYLFWILLTFSVAFDELLLGAAVSLLVTYISREFLFTKTRARALHPLRWANAIGYFIIFVWEEIIAHIDLGYRIITGRINPSIIKIKADLDTDIGRTMVANSITLTPGTLTVRVGGKNLFVHWISYRKDHNIGKLFERMATRVFENRKKWR
jgi:multicomponent Na+:H+ antiporter subunit E